MKKFVVSVPVLLSILFLNTHGYSEEKAVRVFVTNFGGKTISVIDAEKYTKIADIRTGAKPHGVAISPDGRYVFVSNEGDNTVSVINPSTNEVISQITVGKAPNQLAVTRDGKWVYVTNHGDGTVSVIEVSGFKVVDTISVGGWPHIAYPSFDGRWMFVTIEKEQKIVAIDIATRKVIDEVFVFGFPRVMEVAKNGKTIYLTIRWLNGTLVVDLDKHKVVNMVELARFDKFPSDGKSAHGLALTPDGNNIYITSQILNTVSVVHSSTLKIVKEIRVGDNPNWIGFTPDGKFAYVSNTNSSDVSVIDVDQGKTIKSIPVGSKPKRLAVGEVNIGEVGKEIVWDFEREAMGTVPGGWKVEATNPRGKLATWEVTSGSYNGKKTKVLGMTKANDDFGGVFNICWTDSIEFEDGEIELRFKAMRGIVDQGGGPLWRIQDKDNYYIARANPLENNFRVYKVVDGKRKKLASAKLNVTDKEWHSIKIKNQGSHIECFYDGKKYLDVEDDTFQKGKIGLWTKADAVTYFDDVTVRGE